MKRSVLVALAVVPLAFGLTACDPPIPPDVLAQQAESKHVCLPGEVNVGAPSAFAPVMQTWSDAISTDCAGTALTVNDAISDLAIGTTAQADCKPSVSVPLAVDAGVLTYSLDGVTDLRLSPKTVASMLNGEITDWADPAIATDNPDTQLATKPITVRKIADKASFEALNQWLTRLGAPLNSAQFELVRDAAFAAGPEGEIAVSSNSQALANSSTPVTLIVGSTGADPALAVADAQAIVEASSQWKIAGTATALTVTLDPSKKPAKPDGFDLVPPYQAIFPVDASICGDDTPLKRAALYYLLRQDSQGALASANYSPLAESVRVQSLVVAGTGLPAGK